MRNYKKEYENYHSRPEQKIRRAARNAARRLFADADPNKDVHHKDNNPLNNDKSNLSLVTRYYNRREPRLRQEEAGRNEAIDEGLSDPAQLAKEIEWGVSSKNVDSQALSTKQKKQMKDIVKLMQRSKAPNWVSKFTQVYFSSDKLVQQRLKSAAKRGGMSPELMKKLFKEEDIGSVTGPHIAGTGDDSDTVVVKRKQKIHKRQLLKDLIKKWSLESAPGKDVDKKTMAKVNKRLKKQMKKKGIKTNW